MNTNTPSLPVCDIRIAAAAPDATIFRERSRPRYLLQPAEIGDFELVASLGFEFATALDDPVLIHSPEHS